jgi:hypothetical protein
MTPLTDLAKQCGATTCFPPQIAFDGEEQLAGFVERIREEEREKAEQDARRYRALRDLLQGAVGAGVEVNDERLVYEEPRPGEAVRLYWYPYTPVGFNEVKADTLDEVVDFAIREARDA